jgi:hypothetical protein
MESSCIHGDRSSLVQCNLIIDHELRPILTCFYSPNILALNFSTSSLIAMGILLAIMVVAGIILYFWYRATSIYCQLGTIEGLQSRNQFPHRWRIVLVSFVLTVIYLPLSTMAMHVVVWSDDLWVVPNPYLNATTTPPELSPLGPSDEFRDPLDFCWTTTMKRNQINYAPVVVILALLALAGVSTGRLLPNLVTYIGATAHSMVPISSLSGHQASVSKSGHIHRVGYSAKQERYGPRIPAPSGQRHKSSAVSLSWYGSLTCEIIALIETNMDKRLSQGLGNLRIAVSLCEAYCAHGCGHYRPRQLSLPICISYACHDCPSRHPSRHDGLPLPCTVLLNAILRSS